MSPSPRPRHPSTRKVWVANVPDGDEYTIGPCEVLIEQYGDNPPTLAFRRYPWETWGRPHEGVSRVQR